MKLIIALGNPGEQYVLTRHNAGFLVIGKYAHQRGVSFRTRSKFHAEIAEYSHDTNEKVLLVKPKTFYNESGVAVRALLDFYHLSLDDILIVHDDTDLDFGKIRVRKGGSDGGSNGLRSLHAHIGTDFWHIRIGTDTLLRRHVSTSEFVLMKFNTDEQRILHDWTLNTSIAFIDAFLNNTIEPYSIKLS